MAYAISLAQRFILIHSLSCCFLFLQVFLVVSRISCGRAILLLSLRQGVVGYSSVLHLPCLARVGVGLTLIPLPLPPSYCTHCSCS